MHTVFILQSENLSHASYIHNLMLPFQRNREVNDNES